MENTTLCPSCNRDVPPGCICCRYCGCPMESIKMVRLKLARNLYEIIPEGEKFAVTFRGDVKVHDLDADDLPRAQWIVAILNSVIDDVDESGDQR